MRHCRAGLLLLPFLALSLRAADWPQWRGPNRDGVSEEKGLLTTWPRGGPRLLWKVSDIGGGYSTPAVVRERIYLLSSRGATEYAVALDASNGKEAWSTAIGQGPAKPRPQAQGPKGTPAIDGDRVYVLGSEGDLVCLDRNKGKVLWRKHLGKDFKGKPALFGYSESPLVDGERVICAPGGPAATIVALNKTSGKLIWQTALAGGEAAAYASAIVAVAAPMRQPVLSLEYVALAPAPLPRPGEQGRHYVLFLHTGLVGVEAKSGKALWRYARISSRTNTTTPIFHDGTVFCTSQTGGALLKLRANQANVSAEPAYLNSELGTGTGGAVRVGRQVYGTTKAGLWCADLATGKVLWRDSAVGAGALCAADGHLYVRSERGTMALVGASANGYKEKGRFDQPDRSGAQTLCHPVVANGRLYLRDQNYLFCYDVRAGK
jgi:outer membrane protein assembly factor BamB